MRVTNKELSFRTWGGSPVKVPKGTLVEPIAHEPGWYWVSPEAFVRGSIAEHDANYYGFRVREPNTEEV